MTQCVRRSLLETAPGYAALGCGFLSRGSVAASQCLNASFIPAGLPGRLSCCHLDSLGYGQIIEDFTIKCYS